MCTKLAQLRSNKSPFLQSYLHTVNSLTHHNAHYACHKHMTLITFLTVVKYQHNTTPLDYKVKIQKIMAQILAIEIDLNRLWPICNLTFEKLKPNRQICCVLSILESFCRKLQKILHC